MTHRPIRSSRGFTLIEIMIVVSIVAILSFLAMIAIGRIKERAARTVITNNLRQLYDAKEFYFSGSPEDPKRGSIITLVNAGFITAAVKDKLMSPRSYEAGLGWHYYALVKPGESVFAYKGVVSGGQPTGEAIYYPGESGTGTAGATAAATQTPPPKPPAPAGPTVPAGMVGGSTPEAPLVKSAIRMSTVASGATSAFTDADILRLLGAQSPDGTSPMTIKSITMDAPAGRAYMRSPGNWRVSFPAGSSFDYKLTVTLTNGHGDTTATVVGEVR